MFDFLDESPAAIERAMRSGSRSSDVFRETQLFLSSDEEAELERRFALSDRVPLVVQAVVDAKLDEAALANGTFRYGDDFGGVWQDDKDGGVVKVAIVDGQDNELLRQRIAAVFEAPETDHQIVNVERSWDYLLWVVDEIDRLAASDESNVPAGALWYPDPVSNSVVIEASQPFGLPASIDSEAIEWADAEDVFTQASGPKWDHGLSKSGYGGLGLTIGYQGYIGGGGSAGALCTSAFGMTTSSYYYLLTPGHCLDNAHEAKTGTSNFTAISGYTYDIWMSAGHDTSGIATRIVADGYIYARKGGNYDVARIQNTGVPATNCYHSGNDNCTYRIQYRLSLYGHGVGDNVCASLGKSNTYRCGKVTATGVSSLGYTDLVRWDDQTVNGDSGAGVKWDYTAHGVVAQGGTGSSSTLFVPIYYAVSGLGANVICDTAATKGLVCPIVY